ncbi:EAL domain-containing protein [Mobilitalea sibirica]|uniref:EAL domain-containing protein n=1 Tax=Mobilitalea sibirica TaxID=1462919 RepID=A0A8J7KUA3_9FIRM|nr:GGDEF domain-containing phosphodiesterase [Mobilitalea sibirica]MBH1942261.1 EAL domain-containing protein [Mobilitalea sibirica]
MEHNLRDKILKNDDVGFLDKAVKAYVHKDWKKIYKLALRIVLIHFIVGVAWILFSDKALEKFTNDNDLITFLSIIKGWVYVIVMSTILYIGINSLIKAIRRVENELVANHIKVNETNKDLEFMNEQLSINQQKFSELQEQLLRHQEQLHYSEERHRIFLETTNDAIWEEANGTRWLSERWYEITGYSPEDMEALEHIENLIHPSDREKVQKSMAEHVRNKTPYYYCEYRIKTKSGEYKWIKAKGKAIVNDENNDYRVIGIHMDMSELNEYKEKLQYIAYHDHLTGLQNRLALNKKMHFLMKEKYVSKFALLYIDIDKFKNINDTMGHSFGDTLLLQVSERLKSQNDNETLFRIAGDEFIVLIEQYGSKEDIERRAINIIKAFKTPLIVDANNVFITASIGVSLYPDHGIDVDTLLKNADIAVYKAKESGRNRIVFYNEPMNEDIAKRMYIEKNLWLALVNNEFELYYQPQLDLETDCITGFEALIRWNNSELGMISPDRFISIAEDTHLIIPIGMWVLKTACSFLYKLHQLGYQELNIAVNISMLQLLQEDFVTMVMDTITDAGINAKHLELEITESILMESYETIAGKLKLLRARGINIALDDFGKGYSSLNYLKLLPITTLKIDKGFIDTITDSDKNKSFADLIVNLGKSLNLSVIAEGVETSEQKDYLVKHKCNKMQGYLFSKPLPEYEVVQKMSEKWNKSMRRYKVSDIIAL